LLIVFGLESHDRIGIEVKNGGLMEKMGSVTALSSILARKMNGDGEIEPPNNALTHIGEQNERHRSINSIDSRGKVCEQSKQT
jgi:hypothetical protein